MGPTDTGRRTTPASVISVSSMSALAQALPSLPKPITATVSFRIACHTIKKNIKSRAIAAAMI